MINGVSFHLLRKLWTNYVIYILSKNKTTSYTCAFMWYNNDCKMFANITTINGYTTKIDVLVLIFMWSDLHCLHILYVFSGTCWKLKLNFIWFQFHLILEFKRNSYLWPAELKCSYLPFVQTILQNKRRVFHYFDYICILR